MNLKIEELRLSTHRENIRKRLAVLSENRDERGEIAKFINQIRDENSSGKFKKDKVGRFVEIATNMRPIGIVGPAKFSEKVLLQQAEASLLCILFQRIQLLKMMLFSPHSCQD